LDGAPGNRDIRGYSYHRGATSLLNFLDAGGSYPSTRLACHQSFTSYLLPLEHIREAVGVKDLPECLNSNGCQMRLRETTRS
jgi:hypothetical protein